MDLSKLSVLVAEDLAPIRKLMIEILTTLDIRAIYPAANGEEAYELYTLKQPDLIITDWHMPGMDGLELIEKVRRAPKSPKRTVPIIMISGFCAPERISKARDLGTTEFIVKPFSTNDLAKRIAHTVNNPRDFIVTPQFIGPDRRRKDDENFTGESNRQKETDKKIPAKKDLQIKTGKGQANPQLVERSQKLLEENEINAAPIMKIFLDDLKRAINVAQSMRTTNKKTMDDIIYPIMQLKANARIFKYDLIGDLSFIILNFLESSHRLDPIILEIISAQHKTISHLAAHNMKGDCGKLGKSLKHELRDACERYINSRIHIMQQELRQKKTRS